MGPWPRHDREWHDAYLFVNPSPKSLNECVIRKSSSRTILQMVWYIPSVYKRILYRIRFSGA